MQDLTDTPASGAVWGNLPEAELRAEILGELHARPFAPLETPRRVYHFAFLTDPTGGEGDREAITTLARAHGQPPPAADAKYHSLELQRWRLRWEQHTEFTTYTWDRDSEDEVPFVRPDLSDLPPEISFRPPGRLLVAVHLCLVPRSETGPELATLFHPASLCVIEVEGGGARVATDFKADTQGFTRLLVENGGLDAMQTGMLAQRILEIETYRTLALLGFPAAQKAAPVVRRIETELAELTKAISHAGDIEANRALLERLTNLAAELEAQSVETSYRFGASRAYHEIVTERLEVVGEAPVRAHPSFSSFFARRLNPAMRTCDAIDERQSLLSGKLMRATELLRTRIQFELEEQNRDLLVSMNRRARLQLRLQQTVEGLSVAAVSYYLVGLISYLAKGAEKVSSPVKAELAAAVSVPFVVLGVWWVVRRVRKRFARNGHGG